MQFNPWLSWVLGIMSSLIVAGLIFFIKTLYNNSKKHNLKDLVIEEGLQALLRSNLYEQYMKWMEKGFAPLWARENFQNCYDKYHNLGADGVMDDIYKKFFDLPTEL